MHRKYWFSAFLICILNLTACVSFRSEEPEAELKYPTGLAVPPQWQNGATFYKPKPRLTKMALPDSYDAPETSVKNQGQCGSCSHFASIAVYESALKKKSGIDADLSEQNVLNCAKYDNYKCQGSYFHGRWLTENGAPLETNDPYQGRATSCRQMASAYEKPEGFAYIGQSGRNPSEEELREALVTKGALWTTVLADSRWNAPGPILRYGGRGQSNHAVTMTGFKPDPQNPGHYLFHIKNSWGGMWNGDGHVWVPYGVANLGETGAFVTMKGGNDNDDVCVPAILSVPSTMGVVAGKEISLAVKSQNGFTYKWYEGANVIGEGAQIFYPVKADTTVKLVATNKCGSSEVTIKLQIVASML